MGKISRDEFDKALSTLRRHGLSDTDIKDLRNASSGHFDRDPGGVLNTGGRAMDKREVEQLVKYLREKPSRHHLSKAQVDKVEEELKEDLND